MQTQLALVIPDHYRSRTLSAMGLISNATLPLGLSATAHLMDLFNGWYVLISYGVLGMLGLFLFFLIPDGKTFFNQQLEDAQSWFKAPYLSKLDLWSKIESARA